jgi:hypothetical protein
MLGRFFLSRLARSVSMNDYDVTLPSRFGGLTTDRGADARRLEAAAREAWAEGARGKDWTLNVRLSFASHVAEITAAKHIERWALQFKKRIAGSAILIGLHSDTSRRHAHAHLFIPRRWWDLSYPPGISVVASCWEPWLRWRHGQVWVARFSPGRRGAHGAAEYLARDPGTVMLFGVAPRYKPKRSRR